MSRLRAFGLSPGIMLGLPALLAAAIFAPLVPGLVHEWTEFPNLSHGFAIPFIAAYLVWARRERLAALPVTPSLWGLPVLVAGLCGLVIGVRGAEPFIARMALPVVLLGLTLFLAGTAITRRVWLGIAYLVFMIPLPWSTLKLVTYQSRLLDAALTAQVVSWLGVPIYREGVLLHLPTLTLEVADACSSIPAIAALASLGVAYASLNARPLIDRLILIVSTLPIAIFSNIIRLITTALAVHYLGPWTLRTVYHQFNGTVNFLWTLILLLLLDAALVRFRRWRAA